MIDPDFKYPSILRGNVGYDRELPWGLVGTAEFLWSKTIKDIKYQNLNFAPVPGVTGVGGRPFFARNGSTTLSDVILLENTDKGYNWNMSLRSAPAVHATASSSPARIPTASRKSHHGRHVGPGGVELGQRLRAGRPEQRRRWRARTSIPGHRITLSAAPTTCRSCKGFTDRRSRCSTRASRAGPTR